MYVSIVPLPDYLALGLFCSLWIPQHLMYASIMPLPDCLALAFLALSKMHFIYALIAALSESLALHPFCWL